MIIDETNLRHSVALAERMLHCSALVELAVGEDVEVKARPLAQERKPSETP